MTLKEMRERMSALSPELEALAKKGERTAEDETRLDAILSEVNDLGPKIEREVSIEKAAASSRSMIGQPNGQRATGLVPREGAEGNEKREHGTPMQRFLASEQYQRALTNPKGHSDPVKFPSFFTRERVIDWPDGDEPVTAREVRALIWSGTPSASFLLPDVFPTIYRARERDLVMRDVLVSAQTSSDAVTILQESGFTNNAAETAEAQLVSEGAKPESAITFTETTFPVRTIAHWIPITRQLLADLPFMQTYVEQRLIDGLRRREDNQILNGNGTPPNLTGLYATSGTQVADAAYFTANPTKNFGTDIENFDRILRAKRLVRTVGGATATFVVLNPSDYEELQSTADTTDRYIGTGPFNNAAIPTLWGLPVVESENNVAGVALVGDGLMAAVVDRMDATIYTTDSHSDYFIRNILVILAEERIAVPVFRPAAFVELTLA